MMEREREPKNFTTFVTAESLAKRERDEALVDAVLNRDNADSAASGK